MATKNLARTAIEGGRANRCRYEEHAGTRSERTEVRAWTKRAAADPDYAESIVVNERWSPFDKDFRDKLNPVRRFVDKQVGRPWAKIYALIRQQFETRTTAGRHIVFDHILREISGSDRHPSFYPWASYDFYIDDRGILRRTEAANHGPTRRERKILRAAPSPEQIAGFLRGRKVSRVGAHLFWFEPTGIKSSHWERCVGRCENDELPHKTEHERSRWGGLIRIQYHHLITDWWHRQGKKLDDKEVRFWERLDPVQQAECGRARDRRPRGRQSKEVLR